MNRYDESKCATGVIQIDLTRTQYDLLSEVARELRWSSNEENDADIIWQDSALNPITLASLNPYQRINHFPGMYAISRKDYLAKHLKAMETMHPTEFSFFPDTWVLPQELPSLKAFLSANPSVLIVKPPNSSQGKGIFLTKWLSDIPETCVVQRYLENPYLIQGFKFDLRLYVLITSFDPLRVYLHEEGLVRLATNAYFKPTDMNMNNTFMHLTNYAINKVNPSFIQNKTQADDFVGHKRSFKTFVKKLSEEGMNTTKLMHRIEDIILKTICIVQPFVSHIYRSSQPNDSYSAICFQILGFDIFLDSRLRPHLLEVNHTPSFVTDSPLDKQIKKTVVKDALRMVGVRSDCSTIFQSERSSFLLEKTYQSFGTVRSMKTARKEKFLAEQMENESRFQGGYKRLMPGSDMERYERFIKDAEGVSSWKKKKRVEPSEEKKEVYVRRRSVMRKVKVSEVRVTRRRSYATRVPFVPNVVQISI